MNTNTNERLAYDRLAIDRATVRTKDPDGRLRVMVSNISKANVCAYMGKEIPNSEGLGLLPDRIYQLLRDPGELARAASTFNNIPLLDKHVIVTAAKPEKQNVVGATGSDATFNQPYLQNSLVVWDEQAIAGIETHEQKELSSAYRYVADMTPGTFEGVPYDGRMTEIVGNHVALVPVGRAGADVVVGDSKPLELQPMKLSKKDAAMRAALGAHLLPLMAQDGAVPRVRSLSVAGKTPEQLATDAKAAFPDVAFDEAVLGRVLKFAADEAGEEEKKDKKDEKKAEDEDDEDDKSKKEKYKGAEDEDDDDSAEDEDDDDKKDKKDDKKAMDAAITRVRSDARNDAMAEFKAIRQAEEDIRPLVGAVAAMDSAADVYRFALDSIGVDTKGVHSSALPAMVAMAKAKAEVKPRVAMDSAAGSDFNKRFPNATRPMKV